MKPFVLVAIPLFVSGCMTRSSQVSEEKTNSIEQELSGRISASAASQEQARKMLESSIPVWNWNVVLNNPNPSRKGPAFERPREIARLFSNDDFEYTETRKNGKDVFKNTSKSTIVKVSKAWGYWKMIGVKPNIEDDKETFSLEGAAEQTQSFFDRLELPREQIGGVVTTDVMVSYEPGTGSMAIARHVRIHRRINGY